MTPSRAVYRQIYFLTQKEMDTYGRLPGAETEYPFCFVQQGNNIDESNSDLTGTINMLVHYFYKEKDSAFVDGAIVKFHDDLFRMNNRFPYHMTLTRWEDRPQPDTPDATDVIHYIADIDITYTRKEQ